MRKLLISALIVILIAIFALIGLVVAAGYILLVNMLDTTIKSDTDIEKATGLPVLASIVMIETDYVSAKSNLDASFKKLQTSKQKYQDAIRYSTEEEIKAANQSEKYEIGYLWTKIGLYATKNSVVMQANVSSGSVSGLYNISFTAIGDYISISEFIYAIEDDSKLGFRIEDFTLSPNTGNEQLQATFVIRNVAIDSESLSSVTDTKTTQDTTVTQ